MELKDYKRCISQPISESSAVGERLVDDPLFDFVEDQMMKVGSLSHADVQWDEVEHSVVKLLAEKSKDIKLLTYLLQCLHNQASPARFILAFEVMASFMTQYWEDSFPAPGKRGNLPRRKFFSQMAQRFSIAVDKTDFGQFDAQDREALNQAVEEWEKAVEEKALANDVVSSVVNSIRAELRKAEERQRANQAAKETPTSSSRTATTTSTSSAGLDVDHSSDKATKQTLLKIASFLAEQEDGVPLAIRLRRYAVWYSITALPDHKTGGETQLRGMQQDRVKDYQDKMRHPDLALWRQVEQSLTMAPYWFEGHLMSYTIAQKLGHANWCEAIQSEVSQFLERLPGLKDLQFKGGEPFVSDAVKDWLASGTGGQAAGKAVGGDWQEKKKEALSLAKEGGIAVALSMLNDGLQAAREPRDHFYWRMISADLLQANQLNSMAQEQYQTLHQEIKTMSVTDWEPSLVEQLERNTTSE
ncbi:type VI secretion system ImpA domain-containing protein [Salinivibrio kushneri]|uniref:Type VI secretion system ImpA domain-containing protein n=1 Tax=Salinivibrio kushneri TaxID=1908198 RepID=A0AB36K7F6_9GAMM|nr:type VI secretion system protein TssA [Salinivibrio kushneri]OOE44841.1 type VI secretion system ImpA domain-containing protein [Salinivibrio kushneri]OOE48033.1 type VI secretion system ImpA domain-containing protein [Salinivibrio kushneri]